MKWIAIILTCLLAAGISAQEPEFEEPLDTLQNLDSLANFDSLGIYPMPILELDPNLPEVKIEHYNLELMRSFYPLYYKSEYKIRSDIRYILRRDSSFIALWDSIGIDVLNTITHLSGIEWVENEFKIHLTRYLPAIGMYNPVIMPWEGIKTRDYMEAAPTGLRRLLNLIRLLAGRNIKQVGYPECTMHFLNDHPLLQQSAYRFDNAAMILALETANYFIDKDSLSLIIDDSWKKSFSGWTVFESYFQSNWSISPEMPLAIVISNESYNSPLIELSRPPRITQSAKPKDEADNSVKMAAGGGRLGFSVSKSGKGLLEIVDVDSTKIAYSSGLMPGDQVKRVNGEIVRTARDLMGKILDKIDEEGVYMIVLREGSEIGLLLLPSTDYEFEYEY